MKIFEKFSPSSSSTSESKKYKEFKDYYFKLDMVWKLDELLQKNNENLEEKCERDLVGQVKCINDWRQVSDKKCKRKIQNDDCGFPKSQLRGRRTVYKFQ